jgi:hypothetical protein
MKLKIMSKKNNSFIIYPVQHGDIGVFTAYRSIRPARFWTERGIGKLKINTII